jgi:hypothetical protein
VERSLRSGLSTTRKVKKIPETLSTNSESYQLFHNTIYKQKEVRRGKKDVELL